jgi:hypothetical protein
MTDDATQRDEERDEERGRIWRELLNRAYHNGLHLLVDKDGKYISEPITNDTELALAMGVDSARVSNLGKGVKKDIVAPAKRTRALKEQPVPGKPPTFKTRAEVLYGDVVGPGAKPGLSNEELGKFLAGGAAPARVSPTSHWDNLVWKLDRKWLAPDTSRFQEELSSRANSDERLPAGAIRAYSYPKTQTRIGPIGAADASHTAIIDASGESLLKCSAGDYLDITFENTKWKGWYCTILVRKPQRYKETGAFVTENLLPHWSSPLVQQRGDRIVDAFPHRVDGKGKLELKRIATTKKDGINAMLEICIFLHDAPYAVADPKEQPALISPGGQAIVERFPTAPALEEFAIWFGALHAERPKKIRTDGYCLKLLQEWAPPVG